MNEVLEAQWFELGRNAGQNEGNDMTGKYDLSWAMLTEADRRFEAAKRAAVSCALGLFAFVGAAWVLYG